MTGYRLNVAVLLLMAFLVSGCVTGGGSGFSGLASNIRATPSERRGDTAYENKDFTAAFAEYQRAAELGSPYGQFMLANMYLEGQGTLRNLVMYEHWMSKSADNGYPSANYLMGMAYISPDPEDGRRARAYLEKAAQHEHGGAMHMLGLMWASGTGVPQNSPEALRWFRMAQAHGIPVEPEFLSIQGIDAYARSTRQASAASQTAAPTVQVSTENLVRDIQQGLKSLGYDPGPVDGLFGNKTRSAIEAFQRDAGMHPDGAASIGVLEAVRARQGS